LSVGYEMLGKIFAIGYFKGILDASNIFFNWSMQWWPIDLILLEPDFPP
jgi:hypothetical protein